MNNQSNRLIYIIASGASMITPVYKKNLKSHSFVVVGYIDEFGLVEVYLVSGNFSDEMYLKKGDEYILLTIS